MDVFGRVGVKERTHTCRVPNGHFHSLVLVPHHIAHKGWRKGGDVRLLAGHGVVSDVCLQDSRLAHPEVPEKDGLDTVVAGQLLAVGDHGRTCGRVR